MLRWLRLKFKRQTFPDGIKQNAAGKVSFEEFWGTTPYGTEYYDGFTRAGSNGNSTSPRLWSQGTLIKDTNEIIATVNISQVWAANSLTGESQVMVDLIRANYSKDVAAVLLI